MNACSPATNELIRRETHMSVFLAGDTVYKLTKPVRLPYLDFSTLTKRKATCRADLRLNRRPAPDVYLDVTLLRISAHGFSIGGDKGLVAEWLVVMRRLDERAMSSMLARSYPRIAEADAMRLDCLLRTRGDRRASVPRAGGGLRSQTVAPTAGWSACRAAPRCRAGRAEQCR